MILKRFIVVFFIVFFVSQHPFIPPLHANDEEKTEDSPTDAVHRYFSKTVERICALFHTLSQPKNSREYRENILRAGFRKESRRAAVRELSTLADPNSVPVLIEALWDPDPIVREHAVFALGEIGEKASDGIAALERTLQDPNIRIRAQAALAIGKIGKKAAKAAPSLIRILNNDPDANVRAQAAFALGEIGEEGGDSASSLVKALNDPDAKVRAQAALAIGKIGEKASDTLAALVRALQDPDAAVSIEAAWAIEKIGKKAWEASGLALVTELAQKPEEMTERVEEFTKAELWIDPREEKILGYGRQGTKVYLGFLVTNAETGAGKRVAVKRGEGEKAWERFNRQNDIQGKIKSPNAVQMIGVDGHSKRSVLVMDYVEGITLRELLQHLHKTGKRMANPDSFYIALSVAKAIEEAATEGIVHGDIKPENVLIRRDGIVLLTDWESSSLTETERQDHLSFSVEVTREGSIPDHAVTPIYQAPEQVDPRRKWSAAIDSNQLGKILFEMLTGEWSPIYANQRLNKMGVSLPHTPTHNIMGLTNDIFIGSQDCDPDERPTPTEFRERLESILKDFASRGEFQDLARTVNVVLNKIEDTRRETTPDKTRAALEISEGLKENEASGGMFGVELLIEILLTGSEKDFRASLEAWEQTADPETLKALHQLEIQHFNDPKLLARISEVRAIVLSRKSVREGNGAGGTRREEPPAARRRMAEGNLPATGPAPSNSATLSADETLQILFLALENAKDQTQTEKIFEKISSLIESLDPALRQEHLLRQMSFLKTPNGKFLLAHIQGTPLRTLSSGAHFGVALFIKQTFQALFGLDRKPMDKFMNEMPSALVDYFLFVGGAALGSLGYDLSVELPFKFYKRLVYRKLVLSTPEARAKVLESFGKSHLNAVRNYNIYSPLLKRQAAFIAAISFMEWWHTGEVDGKRVAISWLSFTLAGAVVEAGADFLIVKIAGQAWKLKNLSGPWGWVATAVELGLTLLLAHEMEEGIQNMIEIAQRNLALQEKSVTLYDIALDENHASSEIISYFNNEYHAEFKAFRDFRLRNLTVANLTYLKEFEQFRRENDLLYKANLEKEDLESDVNDALQNLRSPVAPKESLLSPTFPVLSRMFEHTPRQRDEYTTSVSERRLTMLTLLEIPRLKKDLNWKKAYEKQVQEFEADKEIEFGNTIESLREENFGSPLTRALLKYQESAYVEDYNDYRKKLELAAQRSWGRGRFLYDTGVSITKIGKDAEVVAVRRHTATDNLIQELAYVERIANELNEIPRAFSPRNDSLRLGMTQTARNQQLSDFFTAQATILRVELFQMIEFLKDPFEIPISADEEQELETLFNEKISS